MNCGLIFLAPVRGGVMAGRCHTHRPCQPLRNNSRPTILALEESIPAFLPAVKQAQPGRTFWPVARQTPNPCRLETGGTRHSANNEVLQQSAATISTIRRIHAPRGACGQETRSAGWVNILA